MKCFKPLVIAVSAFVAQSTLAQTQLPGDFEAKVDQLLTKISTEQRFVGLSVAIVGDGGAKVITRHFGFSDLAVKEAPTDHTIYEIGSITKTFTRLLLAMSPDVKLDDPISKYLPIGIRVPTPAGIELRMQDLALHTGFRFAIPCVSAGADLNEVKCFGMNQEGDDPYKDVTRALLFQFVTAYHDMVARAPKERFPAPGLHWEYSNSGTGLLGELLALEKQTSYRDLVTTQILAPLGMRETFVEMACDGAPRGCPQLAKVYSRSEAMGAWAQASVWHLPGMAGAGAMRSTLADMLVYLKAQMALGAPLSKGLSDGLKNAKTHLPDAEKAILSNLCSNDNPNKTTCEPSPQAMYVGWPSDLGRKTFYHAGATGASRSMIMFSQDSTLGTVILSNSDGGGKSYGTHVPNDLALCIFQLAGKPVFASDACAEFRK